MRISDWSSDVCSSDLLPSHGIAYDVWAGLVAPEVTEDGFCDMPEHPSVGMHAGPLLGALGVLAGITRARAPGRPCRIDVARSEERRVGKEFVRTCKSRWSPYH